MIDFSASVEQINSLSLWIRDQAGFRWFVNKTDVLSIKSHHCVYQDQTVSFVLGEFHGRQQAMDVRPESFAEADVEVSDRETSRIVAWFGTSGFAERQDPACGCRIFVHRITANERLFTGDVIEHSVHKNQKDLWEAFDVLVLRHAEKQPAEPHGQFKKHYRIGFTGR